MSVNKYTIPLGPTTISSPSSNTDGYTLRLNNDGPNPTLYIDARSDDGYTVEFSQDGYVAAPSGALIFSSRDGLLFNTDLLFDPDNTKDIGQSGAYRPRNVYVGTDVIIGNTITISTDTITSSTALKTKAPGNNTVGGPEGYSFLFEVTGEKTLLHPHDQSLLTVRNFNVNVLRVDGYGSVHLGDITDSYGLDASRIVFNSNRYNSTSVPDDNDDAGLFIERGLTASPAKLFWSESNDRWESDSGDNLDRHISSFDTSVSETDLLVCQDGYSLRVNQQDTWQRALIHRIQILTDCTDYDFSIWQNAAFDSKIFESLDLNGDLDTRTSLYYKDIDGYNELHYKIVNNEDQARSFDVSVEAEVFYDGISRGDFVETFDNGDFCSPLGPILFSETSFSDSLFDITAGSTLLTESFDAYGIFDAYAGPILSSDDMDSLGF
jgi:hypothetical protein